MSCPECNQEYTHYGTWCKPCYSKHFKDNFDKWTSGNETIDKIIQNAQLNANGYWGRRIHLAEWFDGYIRVWNVENQQWKRYGQQKVALKKFGDFANLDEEFLNEMIIHLKTKNNGSIQFYGITQDPESHKYTMVLNYAEGGNFRDYLKNNFNDINWKNKLDYLYNLVEKFLRIHKLDIIRQDFHPGNILSFDFKNSLLNIYISDFGLSKIVGQNPNNPEKKIFGVLPYIAPEVLGGEEYTKAADVYSFGIIAYEIVTGLPPYYNIPHNKDLAMKICNGLRPKIPFHNPNLITRMIMRCWDARITYRPTFKELENELFKYCVDYNETYYKNNKITIQIKKAEEFSTSTNAASTDTTITTPLNYQTHPQAIYTSRLLNFSSLPKPKNEENFEKELEELTESVDDLSTSDSGMMDLNV
ncbi:hypothetical protein Glove_109g35 [Diversispora epigaea]|uniref:Protein kinase domain-containing protein n=1 Tax=Diversispora epigaea TaxID=1348612 RepID=A0A397J766_9GLOM|nr:hypothetical protein Glove_109g35 [Diversispora epigaea]